MTGPRPNLSADPADHDPPSPGPPAKPDYAALWLEIMRRQLRGEWIDPDETPDPPGPDGQLTLTTHQEEP